MIGGSVYFIWKIKYIPLLHRIRQTTSGPFFYFLENTLVPTETTIEIRKVHRLVSVGLIFEIGYVS